MSHRKDTPVLSEDELLSKERSDNYLVKKILKFTVLFLFVATLLFLTINLFVEYLQGGDIKSTINDSIVENFAAILFAGLYILGYNFLDRKK